jgi:hypothetical protein
MAAGRKFCDVASQACAVVWSSQGRVRWFHGSPTFAISSKRARTLLSTAWRTVPIRVKPFLSEMEEVPAEAWIKSFWLRRCPRL